MLVGEVGILDSACAGWLREGACRIKAVVAFMCSDQGIGIPRLVRLGIGHEIWPATSDFGGSCVNMYNASSRTPNGQSQYLTFCSACELVKDIKWWARISHESRQTPVIGWLLIWAGMGPLRPCVDNFASSRRHSPERERHPHPSDWPCMVVIRHHSEVHHPAVVRPVKIERVRHNECFVLVGVFD